jgi:hypothetical protein
MGVRRGQFAVVCILLPCLAACARSSQDNPQGALRLAVGGTSLNPAFAPLLNKIWRRSASAYGPAAGSIYIFLSNGTLLETSCVETYRVALWSVDPAKPDTLRVVEDQQKVFSATLGEASGNTLHLKQTLLHQTEPQDVILTAVDGEFVCPDFPKR